MAPTASASMACRICGKNCPATKKSSCEACKQFFRRTVAERKLYRCSMNLYGDCTSLKCRSCRFNRCLLAELDARLVYVQHTPELDRTFFEQVDNRVAELHQVHGTSTKLTEQQHQQAQTDDIVAMESAQEQSTSSSSPNEQQHHCEETACSPRSGSESEGDCVDSPLMVVSDRPAELHQFAASLWAVPSPDLALVEIREALYSLGTVEQAVRDTFALEMGLRPEFTRQFGSMQELLQFQHSPFGSAHRFMFDNNDLKMCRRDMFVQLDLFSCVDSVRSMSIFGALDPDDQVRLVNFVGIPLIVLREYHLSAQCHSSVVIKNGRHVPIRMFQHCERYRAHANIQKLAIRILCHGMEGFNKVKLAEEEFLLLQGIIVSNSSVPGLSKRAQELLQREAERHTRMLMRWEQSALGHLAGAMRFAEVIHLSEGVLHSAERLRQLFTYLAMVVDQDCFFGVIPPAFVQMCLHGVE